MDIIHLLPDAVANQIAAGEVVQRPASVIKELLENSIDAGATQIQVILKESGKELIQVIDNGKGMSPTDARMAFERHATSKITQAADLFSLHTMGFRGEALPSIVAVSELNMQTRRQEDESGVLLRMAGSKLLSQEPVVCPVGTNIEVRNLFYNVPARRNFLKSNQTELSNVITEIQHVALANPQVGFTLIHNNVQQFQFTPGNYKQRILQIFSKSLGQQLIPVGVDNDLMQIEGFICQPEGARKKGALQFFFVNDRYMRHPYFHKAIMECYQELIPEGAQPNYFIYLRVDPATIDVNVHPTKTEIKFQNETARWHILMATVREALGKFNAVPAIDFDQADAPEIEPYDPTTAPPSEPKVNYDSDYNPFRKSSVIGNWQTIYEDFANQKSDSHPSGIGSDRGVTVASSRLSSGMNRQNLSSSMNTPDEEENTTSSQTLSSRLSTVFDVTPDIPQEVRPTDTLASMPAVEAHKNTFRKYLQVGGAYIAASTKKGLLLIDQHQAHIAILFDRYYQQMQQRKGVSQQELFPEMVEVSPADVPILEGILPRLQFLGFEIDSLGGGSFAVNGKPAALDKSVNLQDLIRQMLEVAKEEGGTVGDVLDRKLALNLSRMQAISAGKILSEEEMTQIVDALYDLPEHTYGPNGKLIATQITLEELSNRF
ncbi:MAG: DNA mismatch repair endonuclease MutL [Bacteroidales bacterium]|nr:DNA mismatch repair endonuclease MutL [Bacteroidales bacterium]